MTAYAQQLFGARDLVWAWTLRTLRGRYQQSALGWLWAIVQPAATVAIFAVVFTRIVPIDTGGVPYIAFSYAAVVPWMFLSTSLADMAVSLVQNMALVGKIYFPREALPVAALIARLGDFFVSLLLLGVLMVIYGLEANALGLFILPLVLLVQVALILGIGLCCASLHVFYRDVDPLLKLGTQLWFYASPILYPVSLVPTEWHWLYFLNPMAGIISAYRSILLYDRLPGAYLLTAAAVSLVLLGVGSWLFKRLEDDFADVI